MKSLIEEASTIGKAIEKAWERAGKPQSFSIKVCENPEYGFLGMTKKYGKVVIFFEDAVDHSQPNKKLKHPHQEKKVEKDTRQNDRIKKHKSTHDLHKNEPSHDQSNTSKSTKEKTQVVMHTGDDHSKNKDLAKKHAQGYSWTSPMIEYVQTIIAQTVQLLGRSDISFSLKNDQQNLTVVFNGLLVHEPAKEHAFYKHFAHVLITALRTKFKTEFKYLRLVLSRE